MKRIELQALMWTVFIDLEKELAKKKAVCRFLPKCPTIYIQIKGGRASTPARYHHFIRYNGSVWVVWAVSTYDDEAGKSLICFEADNTSILRDRLMDRITYLTMRGVG